MTLFIRHSFQFLSWIRCEKWEDGKANVLWKYIYTRRSKGENMDKLILRIFPIRIAAWHWYFPYELDYFTYWFFLFFPYVHHWIFPFFYIRHSFYMHVYLHVYISVCVLLLYVLVYLFFDLSYSTFTWLAFSD